jgi:hypothetical protein
MITFKVVREEFGWAVRVGERMSTHFRLRERAIHGATALADAIRRHGATAEVIVENAERNETAV